MTLENQFPTKISVSYWQSLFLKLPPKAWDCFVKSRGVRLSQLCCVHWYFDVFLIMWLHFYTSAFQERLLLTRIFHFRRTHHLKLSGWEIFGVENFDLNIPWMNLIYIQALRNESEVDIGGSYKRGFWPFMFFSYATSFPWWFLVEERHHNGPNL